MLPAASPGSAPFVAVLVLLSKSWVPMLSFLVSCISKACIGFFVPIPILGSSPDLEM